MYLIERRVLTGIGAGVGLCVGPIFLAEIAPSKIRGSVGMFVVNLLAYSVYTIFFPGVLTQFAIVIGLMVTQLMGLKLATPRQWRLVLLFSCGLSILQLLISPLICNTPVWLQRLNKMEETKAIEAWLWGHSTQTVSDSTFFDAVCQIASLNSLIYSPRFRGSFTSQ